MPKNVGGRWQHLTWPAQQWAAVTTQFSDRIDPPQKWVAPSVLQINRMHSFNKQSCYMYISDCVSMKNCCYLFDNRGPLLSLYTDKKEMIMTFNGIGCKVIYEEGLPNIWGNAEIFNHIWGGCLSYMTLLSIPYEFPYKWGKFDLFFYRRYIYLKGVVTKDWNQSNGNLGCIDIIVLIASCFPLPVILIS